MSTQDVLRQALEVLSYGVIPFGVSGEVISATKFAIRAELYRIAAQETMVKAGTAAWAGTEPGWADELRGGAGQTGEDFDSYFAACIGKEYRPAKYGKYEGTHPETIKRVMSEFSGTPAADVIAALVHKTQCDRNRQALLGSELDKQPVSQACPGPHPPSRHCMCKCCAPSFNDDAALPNDDEPVLWTIFDSVGPMPGYTIGKPGPIKGDNTERYLNQWRPELAPHVWRALYTKPQAQQTQQKMRVLFDTDAHCPSCGHNRDTSSTSSIDCGGGEKYCQICEAHWLEIPGEEQPEQRIEELRANVEKQLSERVYKFTNETGEDMFGIQGMRWLIT